MQFVLNSTPAKYAPLDKLAGSKVAVQTLVDGQVAAEVTGRFHGVQEMDADTISLVVGAADVLVRDAPTCTVVVRDAEVRLVGESTTVVVS